MKILYHLIHLNAKQFYRLFPEIGFARLIILKFIAIIVILQILPVVKIITLGAAFSPVISVILLIKIGSYIFNFEAFHILQEIQINQKDNGKTIIPGSHISLSLFDIYDDITHLEKGKISHIFKKTEFINMDKVLFSNKNGTNQK